MSTNNTWIPQGLAVTDGKKNSDAIDLLKLPGADLLPLTAFGGTVANGAIASADKKTITVPNGQSGNSSYVQAVISSVPYRKYLAGQKVTFVLLLYTTPDFAIKKNLSGNLSVIRNGAAVTGARDAFRLVNVSPTQARLEIDYTVNAGDSDFRPFAQLSSTNTEGGSLQVIALRLFVANNVTSDNSINYYLAEKTRNEAVIDTVKLTVKPDGTGNYTSPKLANDAITDSTANKWYEITVYPGVYTEIGWKLKPYTRWIGTNENLCWLKGELPPSASDAQITPTSTIDVDSEFELRNLMITAKNMRYAVHDESSGVIKDVNHKILNCYLEHYGNQEVIDYRAANALPAGTVWGSPNAYGYGSSSGINGYYENTTFKSKVGGWYIHTREKFSNPTVNYLKNCKLINTSGTDQAYAVMVENMGSGTNDKVILEGCEINGAIATNDNTWIPTEPEYQYAKHNDCEISGFGNTPVPYITSFNSRAFKITSNEKVATSQVRISGSAVAILFGDVTTFDGKGGLQGYAYGSLDVSDMPLTLNKNVYVTGMQRRLGNRAGAPVSLTVTFEAKAPISITFNEDYTAKDNTYILNQINTALGVNGTASLYNVSYSYRPKLLDERVSYRNTSTTGIPFGAAVKRGATMTSCQLMASTDDPAELIGFAEQDINPDESGTIKIKGFMGTNDVLLDGAVNFAPGNLIGISATKPGFLINTTDATKVIGRGVSASFFRFKV